jgi:hypothetical protein
MLAYRLWKPKLMLLEKLGKVQMLLRLQLRRLLSQRRSRLRKLKKHLPTLIRSGSSENKL